MAKSGMRGDALLRMTISSHICLTATATAILNAADPAFRPGQPSIADANRLIGGAASVHGATDEQKVALEVLVIMVGVMREKGIDPAKMFAELELKP